MHPTGCKRWLLTWLAACALGLPAHGAPAVQATNDGAHLDHIFVIVLENHSRDSVIGSPYMPQLTALAAAHGVANAYYGVTHPSQPNYIAMIGGDTFGMQDDRPGYRLSGRNLVDQLEPRFTWAAYMESMDAPGSLKDVYPPGAPLYVSKHNPFVSFADIRGNPARLARIKPYTAFAADMAAATVPNLVYIVPNQCHDMHGGIATRIGPDDGTPCPYGRRSDDANDQDLKRKADAFVAHAVDAIKASVAWSAGRSAIFIVADESDFDGEDAATGGWKDISGCCDSPTVAAGAASIGPAWRGGVYGGGLSPAVVVTNFHGHAVSPRKYNHYSLLTTIERNWNLGYLGHAGDAAGGVLPLDDLLGP